MRDRRRRRPKAKPSAPLPVKFPANTKNPRRLSDAKLQSKLAETLAAVEQANRLPTAELVRTGRADDVLAGMRRSVAEIETLRAEHDRRQQDARIEREIEHQRRRDSLRSPRWNSSAARRAVLEADERQREESRLQRRADLEARRAEEARQRHADRVKAGEIFEPIGGWDYDGTDALAAVFACPLLWEWLDRRSGPPVLELAHFTMLYVALAMLAQNAGEPVSVRLTRMPLPEDFHGDRRKILKHLVVNGLLAVEWRGEVVMIGRGSRVERLRRSYQEQLEERMQ